MPVRTPRPRVLSPRIRRRFQWVLFGALGLAVLALSVLWYTSRRGNVNRWTACERSGIRVPLRYRNHGIDVSKFQGTINWEKVSRMRLTDEALPVTFAFIKATEGQGLADRAFQKNWRGAKKAGLRRGAYHFYLPFRDPLKQAAHFVKTVKLESGDLAPVLDVEVDSPRPDADIVEDLGIWLNRVEEHYGIRPIIYTNPHFYKKFIRGHFDDYPLWIADYSKERLEGFPSGQVQFWQHTKSGYCQGIGGRVDFNAFLFDEEKLADICLD